MRGDDPESQRRWDEYGRWAYGVVWQLNHRHPGWEDLPWPGTPEMAAHIRNLRDRFDARNGERG
jgi:hypothetical protein